MPRHSAPPPRRKFFQGPSLPTRQRGNPLRLPKRTTPRPRLDAMVLVGRFGTGTNYLSYAAPTAPRGRHLGENFRLDCPLLASQDREQPSDIAMM